MQQWVVLFLTLRNVERCHIARHVAHAAKVVGPFGDADGAARVKDVEQVRRSMKRVMWVSRLRVVRGKDLGKYLTVSGA